MNKTYLITSIAIITLFTACSTKTKTILDLHQKEVSTNVVYESETGNENPEIKYAYYLPSSYNGKTKLPVFYMLDPHANGSHPINLYAEIAEKQQVILVASNIIKNGMQQSENQNHFNALMNEIEQRFLIDYKQQFVAGFSGGAKLGILFASQMPEIKGAIACGGTIPFVDYYKPNFYFAGIIGTHDFNYLEVYQTQNSFTQNGFDFTAVKFNGGHEWPPKESFNLAVCGMKLYAIKTKAAKTNKQWINNLYKQLNDSVIHYNETKEIIKEYETLKQMQRWFYNIKPVTDLNKRTLNIENYPAFHKEVNQIQKFSRVEISLRSDYIRAIENKDLDWWKVEAGKLTNPTSKNEQAVNVNYRLKNYISMISYMLIIKDLDNNELDGAFKKLNIYEFIDVKNADVYLMYARYYKLKDDQDNMISYFKEAQKRKTIHAKEYENESSLNALFSDSEIIKLLKNN